MRCLLSALDLDAAWRLDPQVSIRPERFGALLYHFGTRRLSFLKSPKLLAVGVRLGRAAERARGVHARPAIEPTAELPVPRGARPRWRGPDDPRADPPHASPLVDQFQLGLDAPICLTWELTYACNLACVHCLSSSGRRDPRELTTAECKAVIDELERMQVFYVNIGGGEPTVRKDFWELVDYATAHHVGVKFSTNGVEDHAGGRRRLAASDYVDVQISLDGATPRSTTASAARARTPPRCARWSTCDAGSRASRSRSS